MAENRLWNVLDELSLLEVQRRRLDESGCIHDELLFYSLETVSDGSQMASGKALLYRMLHLRIEALALQKLVVGESEPSNAALPALLIGNSKVAAENKAVSGKHTYMKTNLVCEGCGRIFKKRSSLITHQGKCIKWKRLGKQEDPGARQNCLARSKARHVAKVAEARRTHTLCSTYGDVSESYMSLGNWQQAAHHAKKVIFCVYVFKQLVPRLRSL